MSGIVGIINLDDRPVDRHLLGRLTEFMTYRGCDAQDTWRNNNVGFGHTLFRTTFESETEKQPLTLDGKTWLTADARIDARDELLEKLEAKLCRTISRGRIPNDAELILLSYEAWGEDCVNYLLGDFAFAIWDSTQQQLFCARDHFGVKQFYYTRLKDEFVFSNSLNCLLEHPSVSSNLNECAIGDFLLFEINHDLSSSAFANVARLPPASFLKLNKSKCQVRQYWTLPIQDEIQYRRREEYVEQFNEVLTSAIVDRLRTDKVAVSLSGGLDSATVAAVAQNALKLTQTPVELRGFTYVYDELMPDEERHFAKRVADHLNIQQHFTVADQYDLYQWPSQKMFRPSEIVNEPLRALFNDFAANAANFSRVILTGDSGDALLYPTNEFPNKLRPADWMKLFSDLAYCYFGYGRIPRMGFRSHFKRRIGIKKSEYEPVYPPFINKGLENRVGLRERWDEVTRPKSAEHPRRSATYNALTHPMWPQHFVDQDSDMTSSPLEFRYPLFDLRVVNFALNIPSMPWCFGKGLLRQLTRGLLPSEIRKRQKTPIVLDPILARVQKPDWNLSDYFHPVPQVHEYVDVHQVNREHWLQRKLDIWMNVRPLSLNYWLAALSN